MKKSMEIWQGFAILPGAVVNGFIGIASEQAIDGVINSIIKFKPQRILELGAGIGTLTFTVIDTVVSQNINKQKDYKFFTIENNEFCLIQLSNNLKRFDNLYSVLSTTERLPKNMLFDFIIIDGGGDLDGDMGIMPFKNLLAKKGVILVEGTRKYQRDLIEKWYGERKHIYLKMSAANKEIFVFSSGARVHNKAYHLYVFEPSWLDALELTTTSFFRNSIAKIKRRLQTQIN